MVRSVRHFFNYSEEIGLAITGRYPNAVYYVGEQDPKHPHLTRVNKARDVLEVRAKIKTKTPAFTWTHSLNGNPYEQSRMYEIARYLWLYNHEVAVRCTSEGLHVGALAMSNGQIEPYGLLLCWDCFSDREAQVIIELLLPLFVCDTPTNYT